MCGCVLYGIGNCKRPIYVLTGREEIKLIANRFVAIVAHFLPTIGESHQIFCFFFQFSSTAALRSLRSIIPSLY